MTTLLHPHHSQNRNWKSSIDGMRSTRTGRYQCTRAAGDPCGCPKRKRDSTGREVEVEEVAEGDPEGGGGGGGGDGGGEDGSVVDGDSSGDGGGGGGGGEGGDGADAADAA